MKPTFPLSLFVFLLLASCSKEHKPVNDPCAGSKPFIGGFSFYQTVGDTTINADTLVAAYQFFGFSAKGDYRDSLRWDFNGTSSTTWNNKFTMQESLAGEKIQVALRQWYRPRPDCFAGETGTESITKTAVIVPLSASLLIGDFKGINVDNTTDTFTIHLKYFDRPYQVIYLSNLPKGCTKTINSSFPPESGYQVLAAYKFLQLENQSPCVSQLSGNGSIIGRDSIQINYKYYDPAASGSTISKVFKGKRIQ